VIAANSPFVDILAFLFWMNVDGFLTSLPFTILPLYSFLSSALDIGARFSVPSIPFPFFNLNETDASDFVSFLPKAKASPSDNANGVTSSHFPPLLTSTS